MEKPIWTINTSMEIEAVADTDGAGEHGVGPTLEEQAAGLLMALRKSRQMSQKDFSEWMGVSQVRVSQLERPGGSGAISLRRLEELARYSGYRLRFNIENLD